MTWFHLISGDSMEPNSLSNQPDLLWSLWRLQWVYCGSIWFHRDDTGLMLGYWWIYPPVSSNMTCWKIHYLVRWCSYWNLNFQWISNCHVWLPGGKSLQQWRKSQRSARIGKQWLYISLYEPSHGYSSTHQIGISPQKGCSRHCTIFFLDHPGLFPCQRLKVVNEI